MTATVEQASPPQRGGAETGGTAHERWRRLCLGVLRKAGRAPDGATPADVAELLAATTYDGLTVQPLYGPEAGTWPLAEWGRAPGAPWQVRQRYDGTDAAAVRSDTANGVTAVWLAVERAGTSLPGLLDAVTLDSTAVVLDAGAGTERAAGLLLDAARRHGIAPAALTGNLGADPLALRARTGAPADDGVLTHLAVRCDADLPGVRASTVDVTGYHDAGGSNADVLACSIATGVAYLRRLADAGLEPARALGQLEFRYPAGADQFDTIALLRAARRLWARVARECGVADAGAQRQHAVTSLAMMTARDPWSNILRTTVACFAAVLGGADAVTVRPFDACLGGSGEPARRLARNTQAVLREEAHLHRVADPAGGSWFVERYTEDLAVRAWDRFRTIERAGGMAAALDAGLVAGWLDEAWAARRDDIARRRAPIVGVSRFADPEERLPGPVRPAAAPGPGLPERRYAEVFEALRLRVDQHAAATGVRPSVLLVPLGPPAARTARTDAAADLFAAAGLLTTAAPDGGDVETTVAAWRASGTPVACLCGPDAAYETAAGPLARALRAAGAVRVWAAGTPAGHDGVTGYLHDGCDAAEALGATLDDLGVR
ncbi:methylmalonyl-CoA mutase family protein [Actinoplanes sp. NPDC049118]|uniref:methylmalonyl-CoA mutase family protein n=1 Tax=Actinoplanes sp. NPDC049118 TaxID=3155769 RepID=UPI0033EA0584